MNYYSMRNGSFLFKPTEGYDVGNLFQNLYDDYKNYKPRKLEGRNEKERAYLDLSRIAFAMHEVNLYLDTHPEDRMMIQLFNDYRKMYVDMEEKYERQYGPITTCSDAMQGNPFSWVEKSFPWEVNGNV